MFSIRLSLGNVQKFHSKTYLQSSDKCARDIANKLFTSENVTQTEPKTDVDVKKIATDIVKSQTYLQHSDKSAKDIANKLFNSENVTQSESKTDEDLTKIATDIVKSQTYLLRPNKSAKDIANELFNSKKNVTQSEPETDVDVKKITTDIVKTYPEAPTTCCMSACANCVWLDYVDKLSEYFKDGGDKAIKEIHEKITDESLKAFLLHEIRMRKKS